MTIGNKTMSDNQISDTLASVLAQFDSELNDFQKFSLTCAVSLFAQRSALSAAFKQFKTHSLGLVKNE